MDNEIERKMDVTAKLFLLVQNRHQTHDWILIRSGANGLGIQEFRRDHKFNYISPDDPHIQQMINYKIQINIINFN